MRIKVFILSLSLSTWYQSQGRKPNSFQFPVSSTSRNLPVTVFHSGHLPHLPILSDQSDCRQKTLTAGKNFPANLPATYFSDTDHTRRSVFFIYLFIYFDSKIKDFKVAMHDHMILYAKIIYSFK